MAALCLHRAWPAQASSSWLASLPSSCCSLSSNQQIVPRLRISHGTSSLSHYTQETIYLQAAASAPRVARVPAPAAAAVAAAAAALSTAHSGSFTAADADDPSTTRARLYALYEFVSVNQRLPDVQEQYQGVAIGQWTEKCRQQQQHEGLEPDLAAALQTIPDWSWEPHVTVLSDSFQDNLQQLAAYAQQYGAPPQRNSKKPPRAVGKKQKAPSAAERDAAVAISKQVGCLQCCVLRGVDGGVRLCVFAANHRWLVVVLLLCCVDSGTGIRLCAFAANSSSSSRLCTLTPLQQYLVNLHAWVCQNG